MRIIKKDEKDLKDILEEQSSWCLLHMADSEGLLLLLFLNLLLLSGFQTHILRTERSLMQSELFCLLGLCHVV